MVLDGARAYRIETAVLVLVALLATTVARASSDLHDTAVGKAYASFWIVACTAAWLLIYLPLLGYPFLSDDYVFVEQYQRWGDLRQSGQFFRPLFALMFWALAAPSGSTLAAFHITSLALHFWSALCVYEMSRRVFMSRSPALLGFVAFLLNPLQLEAVLWVSGLQELLWTACILSALRVYTAHKELTGRGLTATVILVALGLASKETAVCYLLLLPLFDWGMFEFRRGRLLIGGYVVLACEFGIYLWLRSRTMSFESSYFVQPTAYFIKQLVTTPYRFFVQPWNVDAVSVPLWVPCLLSVLALSCLYWTVVERERWREPLLGAFIVLASTLPVFSYFFVREDLFSARYLYFAAFGWSIILGSLGASMLRSGAANASVMAALATCLLVCLTSNLRPWRTVAEAIAVMENAIAVGSDVSAELMNWQGGTGINLEFKGGVPREYHGVGIFINGYDQFVRCRGNRR